MSVHYDKLRGQRMVVTKSIKPESWPAMGGVSEAARRVSAALAWAASIGMTPSEFLENRVIPDEIVAAIDVDADELAEAAADPDTPPTQAGFVYAYRFRGYPDRLKIGYTSTKSPEDRVSDQARGTSFPDAPEIVLTHESERARSLEAAIHAILRLHGREIDTPGGREWFRVTHAELEGVILSVESVLGHPA